MPTDENDYLRPELMETVFSEGESLSKKLDVVKTYTSKEQVEGYEIEIERFLNLASRIDAANARAIDQHRNMRRMLKVLTETLKTDKAEARTLFWELHHKLKESQYRPDKVAQDVQQRADESRMIEGQSSL